MISSVNDIGTAGAFMVDICHSILVNDNVDIRFYAGQQSERRDYEIIFDDFKRVILPPWDPALYSELMMFAPMGALLGKEYCFRGQVIIDKKYMTLQTGPVANIFQFSGVDTVKWLNHWSKGCVIQSHEGLSGIVNIGELKKIARAVPSFSEHVLPYIILQQAYQKSDELWDIITTCPTIHIDLVDEYKSISRDEHRIMMLRALDLSVKNDMSACEYFNNIIDVVNVSIDHTIPHLCSVQLTNLRNTTLITKYLMSLGTNYHKRVALSNTSNQSSPDAIQFAPMGTDGGSVRVFADVSGGQITDRIFDILTIID